MLHLALQSSISPHFIEEYLFPEDCTPGDVTKLKIEEIVKL